jgi:hypothetical protein
MAGAGSRPILKAIETHIATSGEESATGVEVMKKTFPNMLNFLKTI